MTEVPLSESTPHDWYDIMGDTRCRGCGIFVWDVEAKATPCPQTGDPLLAQSEPQRPTTGGLRGLTTCPQCGAEF